MFNVVTTKDPLFEGGILVTMFSDTNTLAFMYRKEISNTEIYDTIKQVFGHANYDRVRKVIETVANPPVHVSALAANIPGIHEKAKHPVTGEEHEIFYIIMDLNDTRGYTRGQIADWLETLDNLPKFKVNEFNPPDTAPPVEYTNGEIF